jgi:hypothetical protein
MLDRETLFVTATDLAYSILESGADEVSLLFGWFAENGGFEHAAYLFAPTNTEKSSIGQMQIHLHWLSHNNIPPASANGFLTDNPDQLLLAVSLHKKGQVFTAVSSGLTEQETEWSCKELGEVIEDLLRGRLEPDCHVSVWVVPWRQARSNLG